MTERKVAPNKKKKQSKRDRAKEIARKNWKPFTVGVVTVVTIVVAKRVFFPNQTAMMIKKMVIKDSVFLIQTYARKQGPPSYLVGCLETGEKFVSQMEVVRRTGVDPSTLSRHLNGMTEHAGGRHYVRLAMAVPRSG